MSTSSSPASVTIPAAEDSFLRTWPTYRTYLDESKLRASIGATLSSAARRESPFPHVFVHPLFDAEFYALLCDAWPPHEAFRVGGHGKKLDLEPRESLADEPTPFAALPRCFRDVWSFVAQVINKKIVGPWLAEVFRPEINRTLQFIQELQSNQTVILEASGLKDCRYEANVGRLMMRGRGYKLLAHVDPLHFLVTALHYFPQDSDASTGTLLYRAERAIPNEVFVTGGSKYFHEHGINVEEAERMPFASNSFLAFPNCLDAAHGMASPKDGYRRVYQYHLSLRNDSEPL